VNRFVVNDFLFTTNLFTNKRRKKGLCGGPNLWGSLPAAKPAGRQPAARSITPLSEKYLTEAGPNYTAQITFASYEDIHPIIRSLHRGIMLEGLIRLVFK
jgi:hypothetical protein